MAKHYKDGDFCGNCIRPWNGHTFLERLIARVRQN